MDAERVAQKLPLILLIALALSAAASFYRFIVLEDYLVRYEVPCDPASQDCFVGCEDTACAEYHFYAEARKQARDLSAACGGDVSECPAAERCVPSDTYCTITYCDTTDPDAQCETVQSGAQTEEPELLDTL